MALFPEKLAENYRVLDIIWPHLTKTEVMKGWLEIPRLNYGVGTPYLVLRLPQGNTPSHSDRLSHHVI
jgi:hypothetical protein